MFNFLSHNPFLSLFIFCLWIKKMSFWNPFKGLSMQSFFIGDKIYCLKFEWLLKELDDKKRIVKSHIEFSASYIH